VFLEEADAFIPQRPYKGEEEMLGAMDRLIRWGRAAGIGATAITQRAAKINKDVTTQAEVLVAHRTIGPQDVAAIKEWIRYHSSGDEQQEILSSLPVLPDGTAWVWSPDWLDILRQVAFRRRSTFDSASTPKLGEKRIQPKALAPVDVDALRDQLAATVEQAKANDPAELRKRIRELESLRVLRKPDKQPEVVEKIVEVPVLNGEVDELREIALSFDRVASGLIRRQHEARGGRRRHHTAIDRVSAAPRPAPVIPAVRVPNGAGREPDRGRTAAPPVPVPRPAIESVPRSSAEPVSPDAVKLDLGARRMLSALAGVHPTPLSRIQLGTLVDLPAKGSTFRSYLSKIRVAGLIEDRDGGLGLSAAGADMMADDLGSGVLSTEELVAMWGRKLDRGARLMLEELVRVYPDAVTREALAAVVEIPAAGSTFRSYLSKIRTNQLLEDAGGGAVRASAALFIGGRTR
jgi:hypothetical protein